MGDIADLEQRISVALARIETGLDALGAGASNSDASPDGESQDLSNLRDALDVERTANAQLEERVKAIKGKLDGTVDTLENRVEKLQAKLGTLESEVQQLRHINEALRETAEGLRQANAAQTGDAHLINRVMMAELDSLRATRLSERTEVDGILEELHSLVEGEE